MPYDDMQLRRLYDLSDYDELPEEKHYRRMPTTMISMIILMVFSAATIVVAKTWWPHLLPLQLDIGWTIKGNFLDWCRSSWALLAWGTVVTALVCFKTVNPRRYNREAEEHFAKGALISLWAGVAEEIHYRWLNFLSAVVWVQIFNVLFFGFPKWAHLNVFGPLADFVSFGQLHGMMFHPLGWFIGAGMLATNANFRDGHAYQGPLGLINSWFIGLFMFWMMFRYGLPAAIVIHALYDLLIYSVRYIDAVIERQRGHA